MQGPTLLYALGNQASIKLNIKICLYHSGQCLVHYINNAFQRQIQHLKVWRFHFDKVRVLF